MKKETSFLFKEGLSRILGTLTLLIFSFVLFNYIVILELNGKYAWSFELHVQIVAVLALAIACITGALSLFSPYQKRISYVTTPKGVTWIAFSIGFIFLIAEARMLLSSDLGGSDVFWSRFAVELFGIFVRNILAAALGTLIHFGVNSFINRYNSGELEFILRLSVAIVLTAMIILAFCSIRPITIYHFGFSTIAVELIFFLLTTAIALLLMGIIRILFFSKSKNGWLYGKKITISIFCIASMVPTLLRIYLLVKINHNDTSAICLGILTALIGFIAAIFVSISFYSLLQNKKQLL